MSVRNAYLLMLQSLLPQGQAWTRERAATLTAVLDVVAAELAKIDGRAQDAITEADPRSTLQMLPDWESVAGLPDSCAGLPDTLQERRQQLHQRVTSIGGQSVAYFQALATSLGYEIDIEEFRPFICGISRCGDLLNGGHEVRNYWRVTVLEPRVTYFRTGVSRCGEQLMSVKRAEDLECLLLRLKPAHTHLLFAYEGV